MIKNTISIKNEVSQKVLVISPSIKKPSGGIAVVVKTLSGYYETFNYIASTSSKNPLIMMWYFSLCIIKLPYFIFIKKIEIVHIHGASYGSFVRKMILINIFRVFKVKIIYHIHGAEFKLFYEKFNKFGIIKKTISKVDVLIVLSDSWKDYFSKITNKNKIFVLNNIVQNPTFKKNYVSQNTINFLFLGIIGDRKGVFDFLKVIIENKIAFENRIILHIGGNGDVDRLMEVIHNEHIEHIVKYKGWVSGNEKKKLLSMCDVYVLPSYNEGLPISVLEAMSYGLPVISTNVGGIPGIISNGNNGFLVAPGDKEAILKSVKYFIDNPDDIKRMGQNGKAIVKDFYPEHVIPQLENIYKILRED